jgi:Protein of unknown function (DUF3667)
MSSKHNVKHHPYCLNCHYPLAEFDKMCSQCGQKPTDGKMTMHDLLHEFIHTLFHLDGKFFWTLKHIFIPGKLTIEFFRGHHKRYAHPVQLFLVLGAFCFWILGTMLYAGEQTIEEEILNTRITSEKKKMLREIDSLSHALSPQYNNAEIQKAYDSLLLRTYHKNFQKDRTVDSVKNGDKEFLGGAIKFSSSNKAKDTASYNAGKDFGANLMKNMLPDSLKKGVEKVEKQQDSLKKNVNFIDEFKSGVKQGFEESEAKRKLENTTLQNKTRALPLKALLLLDDSVRIYPNGPKITKTEFYESSAEDIIEKHEVHGWFRQTLAKQTMKVRKEGSNLLHYAVSHLLWLTLLMIPALSLVFLLLYRRQKRYFVEHFVFLMHYNIFLFIATVIFLPLMDKKMVNSHIAFPVYTLGLTIFLYLAMKNYYQQGWIKTLVKFCIVNFMYFFISLILFVGFAIISFILF